MGQVFFKALIAALGGLVAWLIWEPQFPKDFSGQDWATIERWFMLTLGVLVGGALGAVNGWSQGSKTHAIRMGLIGVLCGAVAAALGHSIAGAIFTTMPKGALPMDMMARTIAFAPLGALIGGGVGLAGATGRRIVVGTLGGLIGAALAGFIFDPMSQALSPFLLSLKGVKGGEIGIGGRAVLAVLMPLFIGLFMGVLDRVVRTAWLRLNLGRNEGKEWVVDAAQTYIGRSESATVPLFGDQNIAPLHACIVRQGNTYTLMDSGSQIGTYLNGQRVSQQVLLDGAQIQIGQYLLTFMMKAGSAPQRAAEMMRSQAGYAPQAPTAVVQTPGYPQAPVGQPGSILGQQPVGPSQPTMMQPAMQNMTQVAPSPAMGMPTLVAITGPLSGQRFPIAQALEAGREAAGIGLGFDTMASRRHASFAFTANGVTVTDLGSTNGTFVNDQRIQNATIRPGDTVKIGITTFRLE